VSGDTSIDYLEVTASGSETESGSIGEIPQAGDSEEEAWNSNTTIKFTGDKSVSGGTIYTGSSMAAKETGSGRITVKGIDTESMSATINVNESINEYYAYGLTVSANGKGGKIILDASAQGAINKDVKMSGPSDFPDMDITYSGSLKVYGADDTEYTIVAIASEDDYDEALSYFRGY
jgi:hypothetical protein